VRQLALALALVGVFVADDPGFSLAVVRRDGVLIPFAVHRGGKWTNAWPPAGKPIEMPITTEDVPDDWWGKTPRTLTWTLWPLEGSPRPVRVTAPVRYRAQCVPGVALSTDYKPAGAVPPWFERPFPKDGLAASGPVKIEKIVILDERAPEWSDFERRLAGAFTKAENEAIAAYSGWRHPAPQRTRAKTPLKIEALYRAPVRDAGELYYVEASRRYPDSRQKDGCELVTFVGGWIRPWKPARDLFDVGAWITYCDRADAEFLFPLGMIRMDGRPAVWVAQAAGWFHERYVVVETTREKTRVVVDFYGGGCPRPRR
jgi:hypothetical protein